MVQGCLTSRTISVGKLVPAQWLHRLVPTKIGFVILWFDVYIWDLTFVVVILEPIVQGLGLRV
jgi:hypothetical protein